MAETAVQNKEWLLADQAFPEAERRASSRFMQFVGDVALRGEAQLEVFETETNQSTMLSLLQRSALGDAGARKNASINVKTEVAERLLKVEHETEIQMHFSGPNLMQGDTRLLDVHRNTMQHTVLIPEMLRKANHEAKNVILFEELYGQGVLKTHNALVWSTTSTQMSDKQKQDYGLFLDTESCSAQLLVVDDDQARLQTAFVAGKKTPTGERHDIASIQELARRQNLKLDVFDGTDMVRYVMLVPKTGEGAITSITDAVKLYDDVAGTFYGQDKLRQDYEAHSLACKRKNEGFEQLSERILNQLISEAHLLKTPLEAIMRLDEISGRLCVKYSINNTDINTRIFGSVSAAYIEQARQQLEQGNVLEAESLIIKAQNNNQSGSCPLFKGATSSNESPGDGDTNEKKSSKQMMNCPFCKARVFDDPCAKVLSCWDCSATVKNGRVVSEGNGGSKARAVARQAALAQKKAAAMAKMNIAEKTNEKARISQKVAQYAMAV